MSKYGVACSWATHIFLLYFLYLSVNKIKVECPVEKEVFHEKNDGNTVMFFLQTIALGNQVGKIYVWDIDVDDPAAAK